MLQAGHDLKGTRATGVPVSREPNGRVRDAKARPADEVRWDRSRGKKLVRPTFADDPRAACNPLTHPGVQPDWWFAPEEHQDAQPRDNGGRFKKTTEADAKVAQAICGGCPLRWTCLDHALGDEQTGRSPEVHGIWGGVAFPVEPPRRRQLKAMVAARRVQKESA